jgi:hypothetical protein
VFRLRDDLVFFEALKNRITAIYPRVMPSLEVESAIKQLVSKAVILEDIKHLLETGKIDILNDEFLRHVGELEFPNMLLTLCENY